MRSPLARTTLSFAALVAIFAGCDVLFPTDPNKGANNGSPCDTPGEQGTCDPTQTCIAVSKKNMCSRLNCTADSECGTFNGVQNRCVLISADAYGCVRGCSVTSADGGTTDAGTADAGTDADAGTSDAGTDADAGTTSICGRDDFICTEVKATGAAYCVPDCNQQDANFCGYGTVCSKTSKICEQMVCNGGGCPDGYVCAGVDGTPICVQDCRVSGNTCSGGRVCNAAGGCDKVIKKLYESCGSSVGTCDSSLACVQLDDSYTASCFKSCTQNSDCTSLGDRSTCSVSLENGKSVCITECFPNFTTCPAATTCTTIPNYQGSFCVPGVK